MLQIELLCIDEENKVKFKKTENFIRALSIIENLWKGQLSISESDLTLTDEVQGIKITVQPFDTSKMVTGERFSSAYLLIIEGNYQALEPFRLKLIEQIRDLHFNHIRILEDGVSTDISLKIYPMINEIENLLRKYIVKFFIAKIGTDWWSVAVPKETRDKASSKRINEIVFTNTRKVVADVTLITFDQLGKIIYSQSSIFTKAEDIIEKIKTASDLESLQQELLQGNYAKYFKDTFEQKDFEKRWNNLTFIRNKVAHNNYFVQKDLTDTEELCQDLKSIIEDAESSVDELTLSIADKEAVKKVIDDIATSEIEEKNNDIVESDRIAECNTVHIESINEEIKSLSTQYKIIDESELLSLLKEEQSKKAFVGLKYFAREVLGQKGYLYNSSFSLINLLVDKGKISIYQEPNPYGQYDTTAIKLISELN